MLIRNLIDTIKFPFHKEKELYRSFFKMLGFYPHDLKYYKQAMMHKSMSIKNENGRPLNNERLEFLGDAILDAVVGDIVYQNFQGKREGFLTNARSKIVARETLGKVAIEIGLDKLILSNGHSTSHNSYMGGNAFEALVGAIYLDRGYDYCMYFLKNQILGKVIDLKKIAYLEMNFKSKLLEWGQKNHAQIEINLLEETRQENGAPFFKSQIVLDGVPYATGSGYSKKESQQNACQGTVKMLKQQKMWYK